MVEFHAFVISRTQRRGRETRFAGVDLAVLVLITVGIDVERR